MPQRPLQALALAGLCCLPLTVQAGEDAAACTALGELPPPPLRPLPDGFFTPRPEAEMKAEPEAEETVKPETGVTVEPEAEGMPKPETEEKPMPEPKMRPKAEADSPCSPWLMLLGGFLLGCAASSRQLRRLCGEQLIRMRAAAPGILPTHGRLRRNPAEKPPVPATPNPAKPEPPAPPPAERPTAPSSPTPPPAPAAEAPATPPPHFHSPFPTRYRHKLTTPEVAAMVQTVTERNIHPPFHKLCHVADSGDAREMAKLHRHYAKAFLKRYGEPTGQPEHKSLLLQARAGERFWFFGDIHCCHAALTKALCYVLQQCAQDRNKATHTLIFCGDVIDRGAESLRTLTTLFCLLLKPHARLRVHFIRGNHDAGLRLNPAPTADKPPFSSLVDPSETSRELNALWAQEPQLALLMGKAFIRLAEISPCMGEILGLDTQHPERALLFTHGGLPHTDLQQRLSQADAAPGPGCPTREQRYSLPYTDTLPEELRAAAARDFTWVRLSETAPHKEADRNVSDCTMGTEDVCAFRRQHWQRTGRVLSYIIRGHDHEFSGFKLYSQDRDFLPPDACDPDKQTECGVLTLNTMEPKPGASILYARHRIALAGARSGSTPAVDITLMDTHT